MASVLMSNHQYFRYDTGMHPTVHNKAVILTSFFDDIYLKKTEMKLQPFNVQSVGCMLIRCK